MCSKFGLGYVLQPQDPNESRSPEETESLVAFINQNVVGRDESFVGPFGRRKVVYCDYAASARNMHFIENYILREVLPLYGNIHTTTSVTSMQSSLFMEEAREILGSAVNAQSEDVVLLAGHGCIGAIRRLLSSLNISDKPIVFFGPCEHHSHLVPWQEIGSTIVRISETKEGMLDLTDLEVKLAFYQKSEKRTLIGCFSAASSTTGILADDIATTILLHQYGALAFWDYGIAAPYVSLDMNPLVPGINQKEAHKDAMFFSGHKFIGGVQSPGILIAKKRLFNNIRPQGCAGVPAFFLTHEDVYLKDTELFEESGTAAVVESVRAGIAMRVKQTVGVSAIMEREAKIVKTACSFFRKIPEIILLGSTSQVDRLAIFSIMVRHPRGAYLHHNFVCAVLNDMFGIQTRGGCSCAGSYAQDLMGITKDIASDLKAVLPEECQNCGSPTTDKNIPNYEMLRPGFVRISLPYFMSEAEIAYVLEAIKMVATEGWKLLPQYVLNPETGEWRHNSNMVFRERKWIGAIKFLNGKMTISERKTSSAGPCPSDFNECLRIARSTFNKARKMARRHPVADRCSLFSENDLNPIRWFMLPSEAQDLLLGHSENVKQQVPFSPSAYKGSRPVSAPAATSHHGPHSKLTTLTTSHIIHISNSDGLMRQRSESSSPSRGPEDWEEEERKCGRESNHQLRERCYSLCSSLGTPPRRETLSAIASSRLQSPAFHSRQRVFSCSSATENTGSETSLTGDDILGRSGTPPNLRNTPDLVYVEGVTKELATEIKSELREVIAQVEDVLAENSETDHSSSDLRGSIDYHNIYKRKAFSLPIAVDGKSPDAYVKSKQNSLRTVKSCCNHNSLPSTISAERFSKYLVGFTSDVVSEMKSELRDVVNAVDGLISPLPMTVEEKTLTPQKGCFSKTDEEEDILDLKPLSRSDCLKGAHLKSILCSQDSGINLSERDLSPSEVSEKKLSEGQKEDEEHLSAFREQLSNSKFQDDHCPWHLPPKTIWNPTCEAIKEFDMIQNGDRVVVSVSDRKESLALLHTLRQFQFYSASQGRRFLLAAAFTDTSTASNRNLLSHLDRLKVKMLSIDDGKDLTNGYAHDQLLIHKTKGRLYTLAKKYNYNVIALGHHLDDISENFLLSVFHNGYLQTMKAKYIISKENLKVIRPFVYVREQSITKFAESTDLWMDSSESPLPEKQKEKKRIKQLLAEQEALFPKLYYSIKSALKPLLTGSFDLDKVKMKGEENL